MRTPLIEQLTMNENDILVIRCEGEARARNIGDAVRGIARGCGRKLSVLVFEQNFSIAKISLKTPKLPASKKKSVTR